MGYADGIKDNKRWFVVLKCFLVKQLIQIIHLAKIKKYLGNSSTGTFLVNTALRAELFLHNIHQDLEIAPLGLFRKSGRSSLPMTLNPNPLDRTGKCLYYMLSLENCKPGNKCRFYFSSKVVWPILLSPSKTST